MFHRRIVLACLLSACAALPAAPDASASGEKDATVTIYVQGFDPDGASMTGVFGIDVEDPTLEEIAAMAGLPTINSPGGYYAPNLVTTCDYYGDTTPPYYTQQDIAELDAVTQQWGGGVPRYALIMAKFARHVLERTGADQVNLIGASFGAEISRWLVTYDEENLTSGHRIARWLTLEGALNGDWAASDPNLQWLWDLFGTPSVDVDHMKYDWVEANFPNMRRVFDCPLASDILQGHTISTDDSANNGALTDYMLLLQSFVPNDGVVTAEDAAFSNVTPDSRYLGLTPTLSWDPVNHYDLQDYRGAYLTAINFIQSDVRVTVKVTRMRIKKWHERHGIFNDGDSEIIIDSRIDSPQGAALYGVTDPISTRDREGAVSPIYMFSETDKWETLDHLVFDDFVTKGETALDITLSVCEMDWDPRYDMWEITGDDYTDMGSAVGKINVTQEGDYYVSCPEWDCWLNVEVHKLPIGRSLYLEGSADPDFAALPAAGGSAALALDAGPTLAGLPYMIHGGFTGTEPGQDLGGGVHLPINPDIYGRWLANHLNTPLHRGFAGYLDSTGRSSARFNENGISLPPLVLGKTLYWAAVVYDARWTPLKASNAVSVKIVP